MAVDSVLQAEFERGLAWKRAWPSCFIGFAATLEVIAMILIFATELFNICMDFWHTNIFGGFWTTIVMLINDILLYATVCCTTTIGVSTCSLIWNLITLLTLATLITFDTIFIINPYTCLLTPSCNTQSQVISLNYIMQMIPLFKNYSSYDSKKFFLEIQVGCAGMACIVSFIYIIIYISCKMKLRHRAVQDYPAPGFIHTPMPIAPPLMVPTPPPQLPTIQQVYPNIEKPMMQWTGPMPNAPYAPY